MVNWLSVKLESEKVKKEVMRNKFKLKGEKIFIKNDLSWEERKIQDKINRWAKTERKRAGGKGRIRKSKNEGGMENMGRDKKGGGES